MACNAYIERHTRWGGGRRVMALGGGLSPCSLLWSVLLGNPL